MNKLPNNEKRSFFMRYKSFLRDISHYNELLYLLSYLYFNNKQDRVS